MTFIIGGGRALEGVYVDIPKIDPAVVFSAVQQQSAPRWMVRAPSASRACHAFRALAQAVVTSGFSPTHGGA